MAVTASFARGYGAARTLAPELLRGQAVDDAEDAVGRCERGLRVALIQILNQRGQVVDRLGGQNDFHRPKIRSIRFRRPQRRGGLRQTYVLPSPLVAGANNILSFVLTGWGPFNFELWGTNTPSPCMAEELLWWGPSGAGTLFADISVTISSWTGTGLTANQYCSGPFCNFPFRGPSQSHFLHLTAAVDNLGVSTTAPVPVTEATWLVQASTTEPFSMACSTEGTLNLNNNGPSTLQLAKVTGPLPCPGTAIPNNSLDLTADRR